MANDRVVCELPINLYDGLTGLSSFINLLYHTNTLYVCAWNRCTYHHGNSLWTFIQRIFFPIVWHQAVIDCPKLFTVGNPIFSAPLLLVQPNTRPLLVTVPCILVYGHSENLYPHVCDAYYLYIHSFAFVTWPLLGDSYFSSLNTAAVRLFCGNGRATNTSERVTHITICLVMCLCVHWLLRIDLRELLFARSAVLVELVLLRSEFKLFIPYWFVQMRGKDDPPFERSI